MFSEDAVSWIVGGIILLGLIWVLWILIRDGWEFVAKVIALFTEGHIKISPFRVRGIPEETFSAFREKLKPEHEPEYPATEYISIPFGDCRKLVVAENCTEDEVREILRQYNNLFNTRLRIVSTLVAGPKIIAELEPKTQSDAYHLLIKDGRGLADLGHDRGKFYGIVLHPHHIQKSYFLAPDPDASHLFTLLGMTGDGRKFFVDTYATEGATRLWLHDGIPLEEGLTLEKLLGS